jgi:hypothetical protein
MLIYKSYIELLNSHYYLNINSLIKKLKTVIFINLTFRMDQKVIFFYQIYIYFFFSINFGYIPVYIRLKKSFRRFTVSKGYLIGVKIDLTKKKINNIFNILFNTWYYYNIFGDLKIFFSDKKGKFFLLKFPLMNINYILNYNIVTILLYNLNIPNLKYLIHTTADRYENESLKYLLGFY